MVKRKSLVTIVGIGLSVSLLAGCASQFSFKEQLAQIEKEKTGLSETSLVNNPYADKTEKDNQSKIVYYPSKELTEKYPNKKWTQAELDKLDKQNEQVQKAEQIPNSTVETVNGKTVIVVNNDSTNSIEKGSLAEAVQKTQMQQKIAENQPNMKIDPTNNKDQGMTLSQLVQQFNAERTANGLAPIEEE